MTASRAVKGVCLRKNEDVTGTKGRDLVTTAGLLFEAAHHTERALAADMEQPVGLPSQWMEVLIRLGRTPGHAARMNDVSRQVLFAPSSFSRLADKMEDAGLVARAPDPEHRRATLLRLTPMGEERLRKVRLVQQSALVARLGALFTEDELDLFESMLRRVRSANAPTPASET